MTLWDRVRRLALSQRPLRQFLEEQSRNAALSWLRGHAPHSLAVPHNLASQLGQESHHELLLMDPLPALKGALIRKDRFIDVDPRLAAVLLDRGTLVQENAFFCLLLLDAGTTPRHGLSEDIASRLRAMSVDEHRGSTPARPPARVIGPFGGSHAIFVTTCNRPAVLSKALPGMASWGWPLLVVDDSSDEPHRRNNAAIAEAHGALYLCVPENRGLPAAMNIGLSYWFADPDIGWITYLQDDVIVTKEAAAVLAATEDTKSRPIITGYHAPEHPTVRAEHIGGRQVLLKRSTPAVHIHASTAYWKGVSPIPSPYLGAPKPRLGTSLEDWWIVNEAPGSAEKMGHLVTCLPGLVTPFLHHRDDSSWDNPGE